jgi:molecular chaperone GrpE
LRFKLPQIMAKDHSGKHDKRQEEPRVPIEIRSGDAADPPSDDPLTPGERAAGSAEAVSPEEFARLFAEKEELTKTLVRRQADFDNYRKRMEQERNDASRRGAGRLLHDLLPVLDALERALRSHDNPAFDEYRKGVELIYRHLWDTLSKQGLERISAEGKKFDPHYHEAIDRVETIEHPDGTIIEVVQEGYLFDGRVLRPSLVRVAASPEGAGGDKSLDEHFRVH